MEAAARKFASWVLSIHVLLLLILVLVVVLAARQTYFNARTAALGQVRLRQELLAAQAARGIEAFTRFVLDDLDLPQRMKGSSTLSPDAMAPLIWERLRGRASCLLEVDLRERKVLRSFSDATDLPLQQLATTAASQLGAMKHATIGPPFLERGEMMFFAAAPAPSRDRAWVALVPLRALESRFLNELNDAGNMTATSCRVCSPSPAVRSS